MGHSAESSLGPVSPTCQSKIINRQQRNILRNLNLGRKTEGEANVEQDEQDESSELLSKLMIILAV